MADLEEMDERMQKLLQQVATTFNINVQVVAERFEKFMQAVREVVAIAERSIDLPRSPEEIKKDIKYEKNPMRIKQLNKELNESYKVYKRK